MAVGVTNCAADSTQLIPMVEATEATTGEMPQQVLADSGYRSEANFQHLESKHIDGVIALGPAAPSEFRIDSSQCRWSRSEAS